MVAIIVSVMTVNRQLRLLLCGLSIAVALISLAPVSASSANISRSYKSTETIPVGSLVSLDSDQSDYVVAANSSNGKLLLGVVVKSDDSLLAVNVSNTTLQIATSGTASVLVSDLNGAIKVGDQIGVSPFSGVGMKLATGGHGIGLSQTAFNSNTEGTSTQEVTDKAGNNKTIRVGLVRVNVGAGLTSTSAEGNQAELNSLQKIAKSLLGHQVATWRIVLSIIIILVAVAALIALTYASIYGSIISIGRNPLGSHSIFKTLRTVMAMVLLTAVLAGFMVFMLLH